MQSGVTPQDCEHETLINYRLRKGLQAATETIASLTFGQCSRMKYAFSRHWLFLAHFGQSGFRSSHLFDFSSYPMKASSRLHVPIKNSRGKTVSVRNAAHNGGINICQGCDITCHVLLRITSAEFNYNLGRACEHVIARACNVPISGAKKGAPELDDDRASSCLMR